MEEAVDLDHIWMIEILKDAHLSRKVKKGKYSNTQNTNKPQATYSTNPNERTPLTPNTHLVIYRFSIFLAHLLPIYSLYSELRRLPRVTAVPRGRFENLRISSFPELLMQLVAAGEIGVRIGWRN